MFKAITLIIGMIIFMVLGIYGIIEGIIYNMKSKNEYELKEGRYEQLYKKLRTGYVNLDEFNKDFNEWYWIIGIEGRQYYYRAVIRDGLYTIRDVLELKRGL